MLSHGRASSPQTVMRSNARRAPYLLLALVLGALLLTRLLWTSSASLVDVSPEVARAVRAGRPVVALESTVVTHGGLGFPRSVDTAAALEALVRQGGAVPATVGVVRGRIKVGLTMEELTELARGGAGKASLRDLPVAMAQKRNAGTTVALTAWAAAQAGIEVFATGGVGGVHFGDRMDVSADLPQLARTPVLVVSAGVKSILDVDRTLEFLETQGVPVASFRSPTFPNFFSAGSLPSPLNLQSSQEVAQVWFHARQLPTGMLLAVPNPNPLPGVEDAVNQALKDTSHVKGKDVTPQILKRVGEITKGDSITTNIGLLKNNALVATEVAVAFAALNKNN